MAKTSIADAIAKTLGDVSKIDTPVQYIPLNQLKPNPRNFYPAPTTEALNALIESIVANGLLEPLTVTPDEGDTYRIISGHSRWIAIQSLEVRNKRPDLWKGVPCVVLPPMSEAQEITAVIEANRQRVKGSALLAEEAAKLKKAYIERQRNGEELPGRIRDRVAKELAVSASKLAMAQATRKNLTLPGFKAQWKTGEIGDTVAYEISKMGSEKQYRLLDWLIENDRTAGSLGTNEVRTLSVAFEFTKRHCPEDPDGHQCSNALRMYRSFYAGGNWHCTGCCSYCNKRDACKTVCSFCKPAEPEKEKQARNPALDDPRADWHFACDHFCKRLRETREQTGLSKKEFAESIEEYPGTYSAWENKSLPGSDRLVKLALCLGVSLDYLFGLTDDPRMLEGGARHD